MWSAYTRRCNLCLVTNRNHFYPRNRFLSLSHVFHHPTEPISYSLLWDRVSLVVTENLLRFYCFMMILEQKLNGRKFLLFYADHSPASPLFTCDQMYLQKTGKYPVIFVEWYSQSWKPSVQKASLRLKCKKGSFQLVLRKSKPTENSTFHAVDVNGKLLLSVLSPALQSIFVEWQSRWLPFGGKVCSDNSLFLGKLFPSRIR